MYDSVCLSVCPHDQIKTAETKITKLCIGIVYTSISPTNYYVQRSRPQSAKTYSIEGDRVADVSYAYPLVGYNGGM